MIGRKTFIIRFFISWLFFGFLAYLFEPNIALQFENKYVILLYCLVATFTFFAAVNPRMKQILGANYEFEWQKKKGIFYFIFMIALGLPFSDMSVVTTGYWGSSVYALMIVYLLWYQIKLMIWPSYEEVTRIRENLKVRSETRRINKEITKINVDKGHRAALEKKREELEKLKQSV